MGWESEQSKYIIYMHETVKEQTEVTNRILTHNLYRKINFKVLVISTKVII